MNSKSSGIGIEGSYPRYCPNGDSVVGGKWPLSRQYQVAPRICVITPMTTIIVSVQIQGKMNFDDQRSKLEDFNSRYKQLVKINLTRGKGTGAWKRGSFCPDRAVTAQQSIAYSHLILCNPQLEQLISQGVMLSSFGISIGNFTRWTCVHYDAF